MPAKGGQFERDVSVRLSNWWSQGTDDSWFWRSQTSGGRATQRRKQNKNTENAVGDIAAQHPEAMKLLQLTTIELKRGYPTATVSDILDIAPTSKSSLWPLMNQAIEQADNAKTRYWWLIHKRDRRQPLILHNMPIVVGHPFIEVTLEENQRSFTLQRLDDFLCDRVRSFLLAEWSQYFGQTKTDVSVRDIRLRHATLDQPFER